MNYDSTLPYPRDLVGYGRNPPHAQWPGQARVAVQFVLNYEEGGENATLHGDAGSEQFLSEMFNPASYPDRHMSMEGIYEYGSRVGVWRILREFEKRNWPLTVFGVATALQKHPELTAAFQELGYDIEFYLWVGLFAPKGTPTEIVDKLRGEVKKAVVTEKFESAIKNLGQDVAYLDQADFKKFWDADAKRVEDAVRTIGKI